LTPCATTPLPKATRPTICFYLNISALQLLYQSNGGVFIKEEKTPNGRDSAHSHLVTVNVAVKRAHRRVQARAVRTPVLVSKLEHLHFNRYTHTTVIFSDADRLIETLIK